MKISLIQMNSNDVLNKNKEKSFDFLNKAISYRPDVIVFSELFLAWGEEFENIKLSIEDIKDYRDFAKKYNVNIILGSIPLKYNNTNKVTNTSFVIDRSGNIVGKYDKKYMYIYDGDDFKVDETVDTISRR
jgi:predicted amidohydrolase